MGLLTALVLLLPQEETVRKLIEQLSADSIDARSDAFRKLEAIGRPALPLLEKAARDPDGEVATRARSLIVRIPIREHLTPGLLTHVSGIYDRLAMGEWKQVFLELADDLRQPEEKRRFPGLRVDDLSFMAPMAVERAESEADRVSVCQAIGRLRLRTAMPSVVALIADERPVVRSNAIAAIRDADAKDRAAALRPCLSDGSVLVRSVAAHALGQLGDRESIPALRGLLKDENPNVRWWAVHALGELQARETVGDVAPLRDDADESVRRVAKDTVELLRRKP